MTLGELVLRVLCDGGEPRLEGVGPKPLKEGVTCQDLLAVVEKRRQRSPRSRTATVKEVRAEFEKQFGGSVEEFDDLALQCMTDHVIELEPGLPIGENDLGRALVHGPYGSYAYIAKHRGD